MSGPGQIELRNAITSLCFDALDKGGVETCNIVETFVACIGAAAIVLAVMPPVARERLATEAEGSLLRHANARAAQMRSGELDAELAGH